MSLVGYTAAYRPEIKSTNKTTTYIFNTPKLYELAMTPSVLVLVIHKCTVEFFILPDLQSIIN